MSGAVRISAGGREERFAASSLVVIGRDGDADLVVDDPRVSRRHAVLRGSSAGWVLEDAGSSNGTYLDGQRVSTLQVSGPTTVHLGAVDGPALHVLPEPSVASAPTGIGIGTAPDPPVSGPRTIIHRPQGAVLRIGRESDNDIVVDDLLASRHHAELRWSGTDWEINDLDSHNGTFVNGRRVSKATLARHDLVSVGHNLFRVGETGLEQFEDTGQVTFEAAGLRVTTPEGAVLLEGVSFALSDRSLLAVVGPSGAGKSTLLNALTGFRPATEGTVLYNGRDLYNDYDDLRSRIGLVPQDDVVHTGLTVGEALEFAAELRFPGDVGKDERTARIDEVLVELGLDERRDIVISKLSGGQRKRVSVALELLTRPSLLFLDEPTSGLDPGYERSLTESLRALADGGRTVVVVTHSLQSLELCDRVMFLAPGGRMAYVGSPQLALAYFGRDDFYQVFQDLSVPGVDWPARFAAHPDHQRFVTSAMQRAAAQRREQAPPPPQPPRQQSWGSQVSTLARRTIRVMASDRRNLMLLLAIGPVLGLLMLSALPDGELGPPPRGQIRLVSRAALVLFNVTLGATWIGASNTAREIVKELPIFRRERAAGLSVSAYVASKALVFGALTAAQCAVLVILVLIPQNGPQGASALGSGELEMVVVFAATGIAAMALGLLISAIARTADQAMTVLPVVLILQLILASGGIFADIVERPGLEQIQYASSAQWGFAASASTIDLDKLQPLNRVAEELPVIDLRRPEQIFEAFQVVGRGETKWRHTAGVWFADMAAIVVLTGAALVATALALRRHDPGV